MWLSNGITLRNVSQASGGSGEISAELIPVRHRANREVMLFEEVSNRLGRVEGSSSMNVDCTVLCLRTRRKSFVYKLCEELRIDHKSSPFLVEGRGRLRRYDLFEGFPL